MRRIAPRRCQPRTPWLVDSVYPTSHFNPGATDSVLIAGPTVGRTLTRNRDVKAVTNVMVSNPTVKKIDSDTVAFASGTLGILKLRLTGNALDAVAFTPYPGFEDTAKLATDDAINGVLAEVDAARRAVDDASLLAAIGGMDRLGVTFQTGINGVYNLFDRDGNHYCVFGGNQVLKTTDDNSVDSPARIVKSVDVAQALPGDAAKAVTRIIGLNMTYDGFIAAAAPGALVVLDRDLNIRDFVTFPDEAVDNSIAIDEHNGIYVVTSRRMLKVIWNGESLSTDEAGRRMGFRLRMDTRRQGARSRLNLARLGNHPLAHGIRRRLRQASDHRRRRPRGHQPGGVLARRHPDRLPAAPRNEVPTHRRPSEDRHLPVDD